MFWELIAVFVAGFAGAGAVMLLNRVTGGRLPRWLMPLGAGAAMLVATISSEYGWYGRDQGGGDNYFYFCSYCNLYLWYVSDKSS